jgi:hypothetical protein
MEKLCRRLLLRMGARTSVGVGQAWTAWRVFALRDKKVAYFALKLRHMTSHRALVLTFDAWRQDWLCWLDMQDQAARTCLIMRNADALKVRLLWVHARQARTSSSLAQPFLTE